ASVFSSRRPFSKEVRLRSPSSSTGQRLSSSNPRSERAVAPGPGAGERDARDLNYAAGDDQALIRTFAFAFAFAFAFTFAGKLRWSAKTLAASNCSIRLLA